MRVATRVGLVALLVLGAAGAGEPTRVDGGAWQAGPRRGLTATVSENGARFEVAGGPTPRWVALSLTGYGRGERVHSLPQGSLAAREGRIEHQRGVVTEWYEQKREGVEQGFTLLGPPETTTPGVASAGAGARAAGDGAAYLVLATGGNLAARVSAGGGSIDFVPRRGGMAALSYGRLAVWDATGRPLEAWMEGFRDPRGRGIRLVFDDAEAVYPVTVDPMSTTAAWTTDSFTVPVIWRGWSVSTAGDVNGDGYDDVIVGAPEYPASDAQPGLVMVHYGSPVGLSAAADWYVIGDRYHAFYGTFVSDAGDVNGDGFDDVVFSAGNNKEENRVFVVLGSALGLEPTWSWSYSLGFDSGSLFTGEGPRVARAGDVNCDGYDDVLVGFPQFGADDRGAAYLFHGSPAGPAPAPDWSVEWDGPQENFGKAIAGAGDVNADDCDDVVIGVAGYDNVENGEGVALVYHGSPSGLSTVSWSYESNQSGIGLGSSVAGAGDVNGDGFDDLVVSASSFSNEQSLEGAVFAFYGSDSGLPPSPSWSAESDLALAVLGETLAGAGDVNGDGFADILVGSTSFDNGEWNEGFAAIYHGGASGPGTTWDWANESNQEFAEYGFSLSTAGDVNGDGYDDVIIGAPLYDDGANQTGEAFVYHGAADLCPAGPADDGDGDGLPCSEDNCPAVANPGQEDADSDAVGDACDNCIAVLNFFQEDIDADGVGDGCDVCRWTVNPQQADEDGDGLGNLCDVCPRAADPSQTDADGDGAGDACDCQVEDVTDRAPAAVAGMTASRSGTAGIILDWQATAGADLYSVLRGDLDALAPGAYGACLAEGIPGTSHEDAQALPAGAGRFYLVQGQSFECGLGSLGLGSSELERVPVAGGCVGAPHTDAFATGETTVEGTVSGDLGDTLVPDDVYEELSESLSGGVMLLDHRWTLTVPAGSRIELHVEGRRQSAADGELFVFEYSFDGVSWKSIQGLILPTSDLDTDQWVELGAQVSGTLTLRVIDTNRTDDTAGQNVRIDELFIRSVP